MSLRQKALSRLRALFGDDPPSLRFVFVDGKTFDFVRQPKVEVTFRSPGLARALFSGRMGRLGDAYVRGDVTVDGPIEDILGAGLKLAERVGRFPRTLRLLQAVSHIARPRSRRTDAAAISHHYDVSNDFYELWLDRSMSYSCGYFHNGGENIDQAQAQKLDRLCQKLRLRQGDHVLDVGCGWGGWLAWAAQRYGVTGVGITNSSAQHAYARKVIADAGLASRIDIQSMDYRDLSGTGVFDKIVSVGMYEHVGLKHLGIYLANVQRLLKPGGMFLNQGIVATDPEGRPQGPPGGEFIDRHVFPGGEVPPLPMFLRELMRCRFEVVDVEDLRPHYARTLVLWTRRLEAHRDAAIEAAGIECYRIWRIYLAAMAYVFDRGWLSSVQVLAYRALADHPAPRPWLREGGREAPMAAGLDWAGTGAPRLREQTAPRAS